MATKRPNTIGSNPLKASSAKSLQVEKGDLESSSAQETTVSHSSAEQVFEDAVSTSKPKRPRVRRSAKETEALFEAQLQRNETTDRLDEEKSAAQVSAKPEVHIQQDEPVSTRHREAMVIVKTWSQWSVVAGMTPVPLLDTIVLSGTQIKLIQLLCKHYDVPFEHKVALAVATGLVGSTATITIAGGITRSLLKNVPILGQIFNWTVEPALSFGATYAIGATFVRHFEADGNLLSFKGEQMKEYAAEQYQKGKNLFLSKKNATAA